MKGKGKGKGKGGRADEERLAARYRYFLDFYPREFRDSRGEELVGTLLDCARPGQARPSWREVRALVLEGLRARAGTGGHRPARATLARGVRLGPADPPGADDD
jgi:hypothetical protein